MRKNIFPLFLVFLVLLFPFPSLSQDLGIKTGLAFGDLDQFFFGIFTPILLESSFYLQPTFEIGAGDNATTLYLSMDLLYRIRRNFSTGGGIGILYNSFSKRETSQTDPSLSLFFRFLYPLKRTDLLWEIRAQISDYSQIRLSFGIFL